MAPAALAQGVQGALGLCTRNKSVSRLAAGCLRQRCALGSSELKLSSVSVCSRRRGPVVTRCDAGAAAVVDIVKDGAAVDVSKQGLTKVMKFGGVSVGNAERMRAVADLILSFPEERPVIVLSAMGETTNNLVEAGKKAVVSGRLGFGGDFQELERLHVETAEELGVDEQVKSEVRKLLAELQDHLTGIAFVEDLSARSRDRLMSFGERLSTRIFAGYLNRRGVKARQYDAFDIGFLTSSEFTNAEIHESAYEVVGKTLRDSWEKDGSIPVLTGFLGYVPSPEHPEKKAITTLGRGGSDLTATAVGKALALQEVQVWKDVDGVLTCDPRIYSGAKPVPFLSWDEACELAYFGAKVLHPESMLPARESNIPVRVKNIKKPNSPGTLITQSFDKVNRPLLTSIVLKRNVPLLDIVSTRMLGRYGFLAKVFGVFEALELSVDVVATSDVSVSLTLDPRTKGSGMMEPLRKVQKELTKFCTVNIEHERSIISLIGDVDRSSLILERAFCVLRRMDVNVQMISQGASKVNISLIVNNDQAEGAIRELHVAFFEQ